VAFRPRCWLALMWPGVYSMRVAARTHTDAALVHARAGARCFWVLGVGCGLALPAMEWRAIAYAGCGLPLPAPLRARLATD
jgi:hypothetical protein